MVLLRKLRLGKGMSINKLSKEADVPFSTILNMETKHYKTSEDRMKKLADYFGIKEPLELIATVSDTLKVKGCQNQGCPLNEECYCQSEQICNGASCESQNLVTDKPKNISFNNTKALFID